MEEPTQGMKLETDKIRIELTKPEYLQDIIIIEQENSDFIGQYDFNEHFAVIRSIDELHLSIFEKSTNLLTGFIVLTGLKDTNNSIEFRRIAVTKKGKGIGSDAVMLIKKYCFELLNAHRIWLDVFEENNRAIRLYKAQGFKTEGLLREAIKRNGQYRSLRIMSALVNDYDAVYPLQIDHTCLIVQNIKETSEYLQKLFDFEIKLKHDYNDTLICENKAMHFFVQQKDFPREFLCEQHISLRVDSIKAITNKLEMNNIEYEIGEFHGFKHSSYKWIEWRDMNKIRFECVEEI